MNTHIEEPGPSRAFAADVFARDCPSHEAVEHVGSKWGILILTALRAEPLRFNALRRKVTGVSEKVLSQRLHALERDGFVHREVRTAIPPHVEYSLEPMGEKVADHLLGLIEVLESNVDQVTAARAAYDEAA